jgi:iron complex outermembrane receptor protein
VPFNCNKVRSLSYSDIGPKAQIVDTYELGVRGASGPLRASLAGFVSTSEQGVSFDAATNRITQQAEVIWGAEFTGSWTATESLTLGTVLRYQEGRFDSDRNGTIDSYLPNNRIGAPYRGLVHADYRFVNGVVLRLEGEGFSGRDQPINTAGTRYPIDGAFIMNAALSVPWQGGTVYFGASNIFDTTYENPTATSVRNLPVFAWGRTLTLGYRKTF